jgi:3'-5' exoribonuclease
VLSDGLRVGVGTIPAAIGVHHAYVGGTLILSLSVAKKSLALANTVQEANTDLCVVGGLLHDVGKLQAYGMDLTTIRMTNTGKLFEHAHLGASMIMDIAAAHMTAKASTDYDKLMLLQHIILSHHGTLEFGAVVEPQCIEAHLVHIADDADAKCEMIIAASNKTDDYWTDKIWGLNNRQMISYKAVDNIFAIQDTDADYVETNDAAVAQ